MLKQATQGLFYFILTVCGVIMFSSIGGVALEDPTNIFMWIFLIGFSGCFTLYALNEKKFEINYTNKLLLIFVCIITVSFLFSVDKTLGGLLQILALWALVIFSVGVFNTYNPKKKILVFDLILIVSFYHAFLAYFQIFEITGLPDWIGLESTNITRLTSTFRQPNVLSVVLNTGVILGFLSYSSHPRLWKTLIPLLFIPIIYFTFSRVGYVSLGLIFLYILFITNETKWKYLTVMVLGVALTFVITTIPDLKFTQIEKDILDASIRKDLYITSLKIFKEHWLLGFGYSDFTSNFFWNSLSVWDYQEIPEHILIGRFAHPHNEVMFWALQGGILALFACIFIILFYLRFIIKTKNLNSVLILPIALHFMVEQPYMNILYEVVLFIFLLNIIDPKTQNSQKVDFLNISMLAIKSLIIILTISLIIIFSHGLMNMTHFIKNNWSNPNKTITDLFESQQSKINLFAERFVDYYFYKEITLLAQKSNNKDIANIAIDYYEKRIEYLPWWNDVYNLFVLYKLQNNKLKMYEVDQKMRFYFKRKFKNDELQ